MQRKVAIVVIGLQGGRCRLTSRPKLYCAQKREVPPMPQKTANLVWDRIFDWIQITMRSDSRSVITIVVKSKVRTVPVVS
jgi:hypothetical protein